MDVAVMCSKLRIKSGKQNWRQTDQTWTSRERSIENDGIRLESQKHGCRHLQECYRRSKLGHIVRYCSSSALVKCTALKESAITTIMIKDISWWVMDGYYWQWCPIERALVLRQWHNFPDLGRSTTICVTAARDPGRVTAILYSLLTRSLRSLAIILPIHLHLISLTSTFAIVFQ
jgi:hypothetical protein